MRNVLEPRGRRIRSATRRTVLVSTALLFVALAVPVLAEEEILLSLPRDFDVTAWSGGNREGVVYTPLVLHFRSGRVTGATRGEVVRAEYRMVHTGEFRGTLSGGRLRGRYLMRFVDPGFRYRGEFIASGTARPDGRLTLRFRLDSHEHLARNPEGGWRDITSEVESQTRCKVPEVTVRLPVGELQDSQKLSTPPPTRARPRVGVADAGTGEAAVGGAPAAADDVGGEASVGGGAPITRAEGDGSSAGDPGESPWSVPVTPGAAAGAGAAVALTSLLGALWMFGTSGLSPGDLLGSPPETDAPEPPSAEAPPPRELFVERHRDGEVNPDTGEVWSESVGGWVGSNFHEIERREQAQVRRAQGVSARESRRESARIAEELRASRKRETAAVRRGEQAADEALRLEAVTIDPYQPGIVDDITTGLERAEWATDNSISVLGSMTGPTGEKIAQVYTVAKETVKGLSEGVADYRRGKGGHAAEEGSLWVIVERGAIGASKGAAKVGLDAGAGKLMDGAGAVVSETGAAQGAKAVVKTVTDQLDSPAGVETCRSVGVGVGKTLVGSEMAAPANKGIKAVTGESM